MRRRMFLLTAAAAATGCLKRRPLKPNPFEPGAGRNTIRLDVANRNFNQANLAAVSPAHRRLGVVIGNGHRSFTLPWNSGDQLRVHIDLLAGGQVTSNALSLETGEAAYLVIEKRLQRSLLTKTRS